MTALPQSLPAAAASSRWPTALLCLALALAVYLPAAAGASLLQFDDNFFFGPDPRDNPSFREGLAAVFDPSRPIANAYLPVAHASLWFDWWLAKGTSFWPHVHAILLHALAGFVLARFLLQLGASRAVAGAATALFLVHPALAESVAWVSGRKDLLSGLFVFAALHQTVLFARRPTATRALGLALLAALAMYSKPTAVVLPLLAALVCLCTTGPRTRWLAPAVLALIVAPIALHHQAIAAAEGTMAGGSAQERLGQVPGAFLHYLAAAAWPLHLNVLYPEVQTLERFRAAFAGGAIALAAAAAAAFAAWRAPSWRLAGFGLAAFAIALLPFNTAFPASSIAAADRYLYLAIPGLALAFAVAAEHLFTARAWSHDDGPARSQQRDPDAGHDGHGWRRFDANARATWLLAAFLAAVGVALAGLAFARAQDFRDDETLWRASLAQDTDNAVAHLDFFHARQGRANAAEVREHLEAAAKAARYPIHEVHARQYLVALAVGEADYPRAAAEAKLAIAAAQAQLARETNERRRGIVTVLLLQCQLAAFEPLQLAGDDAGADAVCAAAVRLAPEHPDVIAFGAMRELAKCRPELLALAKAGKAPVLADDDARAIAAVAAIDSALAKHPAHAGLLCARADWDRARGRVVPALRSYQLAVDADKKYMAAWLGRARLLRENEQWASAEQTARDGLVERSDPALRQELALALFGQGKLDEAQMHLEAYMRVHPDDKDTAKVLSNVLVGRALGKLGDSGDVAEVLKLVERALAYNPNEVRAHVVLGKLAKDRRNFAEATRHFERAFRHMPDYEEARDLYAESLAALGWQRLIARDEDAAVAAWTRCVEVAPKGFELAEIEKQLQRVWARCESEGIDRLHAGDRAGAAASFRRCLTILPQQHWAAWLLAQALDGAPGEDLAELEKSCRQAIVWQEKHAREKSQQVLLLARTLVRAGRRDDARALARDYVKAPEADANPQVVEELRRLAGG